MNKSTKKLICYREHIVTDQGNGGSFCSNCGYNFGSNAFKVFDKCPGCHLDVKEGGLSMNIGGSD